MIELVKQFGMRLAFLREIRNLTQYQLANRLGITVQHYGKLERGQSGPSFKLLPKLSNALGVTVAELFYFEDIEQATPLPLERKDSNEQIVMHKSVGALQRKTERKPFFLYAGEGYWEWNIRHELAFFSPEFASILGYKGEDAALLRANVLEWRDRIAPEDMAALKKLYEGLFGKVRLQTIHFEAHIRHKKGHYVRCAFRGACHRGKDGRLILVTGAMRPLAPIDSVADGEREPARNGEAHIQHEGLTAQLIPG